MMDSPSTLLLVGFALVPLAITIAGFAIFVWIRTRGGRKNDDQPMRLLSAAVRHIPRVRRDWGVAMLAELNHIQGFVARWRFALSCSRVALFPPATTRSPWYLPQRFNCLGPVFGALSVALPPLGLPLLFLTSVACNAFMENGNFSSGEWIPTILGACIVGSLVCILAGVPLGIVGIMRREKVQWLSYVGPILSMGVFGYLQLVQHLGTGLQSKHPAILDWAVL